MEELKPHRVFICYHHENDQYYKEQLVRKAEVEKLFIDWSVGDGEIPDDWSDEKIRKFIRDNYLKDSRVTIVLVGSETRGRKHIDWEIRSSMYDGKVNRKSGIIAILLPGCESKFVHVPDEADDRYYRRRINLCKEGAKSKSFYKSIYPSMPDRIVENLAARNSLITIVNWSDLSDGKLAYLIEHCFKNANRNKYVLSTLMRKKNSPRCLIYG